MWLLYAISVQNKPCGDFLEIISQVENVKLGHLKDKLYIFTHQIKGKNLGSWYKRDIRVAFFICINEHFLIYSESLKFHLV